MAVDDSPSAVRDKVDSGYSSQAQATLFGILDVCCSEARPCCPDDESMVVTIDEDEPGRFENVIEGMIRSPVGIGRSTSFDEDVGEAHPGEHFVDDVGQVTHEPVYLHQITERRLNDSAKGAILFCGKEELLRASSLTTVMRCGCSLFATSAGSADTYNLSERVEVIDVFISHNWAVHRCDKFLALSLHFNLIIAIHASFFVTLLLGLASGLGALPDIHQSSSKYRTGFCCRSCSAPVFVIVLFFARDILGILGHKGKRTFLDKTCIHQEDLALQREGIEKLGAFMYKSEEMLILYTDVYVKKLWTVYELATYLCLRPTDHITILPISWCKCLFFTLLAFYLGTGIAMVIDATDWAFGYTLEVAELILCSVGFWILRRVSRKGASAREELSRFRVDDCLCAVQDDRKLLYRNIAALMRASGRVVEVDSSDDDALKAFVDMVRCELPAILQARKGFTFFPYSYLVAAAAVCRGAGAFDKLGGLTYGMPWRVVCAEFVLDVALVFGGYPCALATMSFMASSFKSLDGWKDVAWHASGIFFIGMFFFIGVRLLRHLQEEAGQSNVAMVAFIVVSAFLCTLPFFAFSRYSPVERPWRMARRLQSTVSSAGP